MHQDKKPQGSAAAEPTRRRKIDLHCFRAIWSRCVPPPWVAQVCRSRGRCRRNRSVVGRTSVQDWPMPGRSWRSLSSSVQHRPTPGQTWPGLGHVRTESDQVWAMLVQHRANVGRSSADVGTDVDRCRPHLARNRPTLAQSRPMLGKCRPTHCLDDINVLERSHPERLWSFSRVPVRARGDPSTLCLPTKAYAEPPGPPKSLTGRRNATQAATKLSAAPGMRLNACCSARPVSLRSAPACCTARGPKLHTPCLALLAVGLPVGSKKSGRAKGARAADDVEEPAM